MNTFDHPLLSSCKVICLSDIYYAKVSIVKPVVLFLLLLMTAMTICVCLFLFQIFCAKKHLHTGQRSCIEVTAFLKSFTVFIFLLQNSGRSDNSVSTASQPSTLCTNVLTAALTLYSRIRLGEFPSSLHMS